MRFNIYAKLSSTALLAATMAACAVPPAPQFAPARTAQARLGALAHTQVAAAPVGAIPARRWLAAPATALIAALPTDPAQSATPARADAAAVNHWIALLLQIVPAENLPPPYAAHAMMRLSVALNDALQVSAVAQAQGLVVDETAVLAGAAQRVLRELFPLRSDQLGAAELTWSWQLGDAVAAQVLAWEPLTSGAGTLSWPAPREGEWHPTPPQFAPAQTPEWGQRPLLGIADPERIAIPAPPAWGSPEFAAIRTNFAHAQAQLSAEDRALAAAWDAAEGSVTPAGLWVQRTSELIATHDLSAREAAAVHAAVGVALYNASVACWGSKYTYRVARPIQWMQAHDAGWQPHLRTPPHPAYPSGHASFSGAASELLATFFPDHAAQLRAEARAAAWSRVVGGIHWPLDSSAGMHQGRLIAQTLSLSAESP